MLFFTNVAYYGTVNSKTNKVFSHITVFDALCLKRNRLSY